MIRHEPPAAVQLFETAHDIVAAVGHHVPEFVQPALFGEVAEKPVDGDRIGNFADFTYLRNRGSKRVVQIVELSEDVARRIAPQLLEGGDFIHVMEAPRRIVLNAFGDDRVQQCELGVASPIGGATVATHDTPPQIPIQDLSHGENVHRLGRFGVRIQLLRRAER